MKLDSLAETPRAPVFEAPGEHVSILVTASAFLLLLAVVSADVKLSTRFGVLLFYLIPIAWTAWLAGQNPALVVAVSCSLARFGIEIVEEQNAGLVQLEAVRPELVWSITSELLFFLLFTGMMLKIQSQLALERARTRRDALTHLFNAVTFEQAVAGERERLQRYGQRPSLIVFDLDNFKAVNDRFGHATGDEVLQTVARIVGANIRQIDVAARLGGDQFALLLPQTNLEEASVVLQRMRIKIMAAMEGREWPITVSFGCVTFCHSTSSVAAMFQAVDSALIQAKNRGKNRIFQTTFQTEESPVH